MFDEKKEGVKIEKKKMVRVLMGRRKRGETVKLVDTMLRIRKKTDIIDYL